MSNNAVITSAMYEMFVDEAYLLPNIPCEIAERLDILQRTVQRTVTSIVTHLERKSEEEEYIHQEFWTVMIAEYKMLLRDRDYIRHKVKQLSVQHTYIVLLEEDIDILCQEVEGKIWNILRLIPEMLPSTSVTTFEEDEFQE